jgi:hypothetical protein
VSNGKSSLDEPHVRPGDRFADRLNGHEGERSAWQLGEQTLPILFAMLGYIQLKARKYRIGGPGEMLSAAATMALASMP